MILVDIILWVCLSFLCTKDLNKEFGDKSTWLELASWQRAILILVSPLAYIYYKSKTAFKK